MGVFLFFRSFLMGGVGFKLGGPLLFLWLVGFFFPTVSLLSAGPQLHGAAYQCDLEEELGAGPISRQDFRPVRHGQRHVPKWFVFSGVQLLAPFRSLELTLILVRALAQAAAGYPQSRPAGVHGTIFCVRPVANAPSVPFARCNGRKRPVAKPAHQRSQPDCRVWSRNLQSRVAALPGHRPVAPPSPVVNRFHPISVDHTLVTPTRAVAWRPRLQLTVAPSFATPPESALEQPLPLGTARGCGLPPAAPRP